MGKNSIARGPDDIGDFDYARDLGDPGEYPFTRGIHRTMYCRSAGGRLWTMRQFAGFGSAEDTNARFKKLLAEGETGLSVAFDQVTLYGFDADDPIAVGQTGYGGVAVSSLADMEALFDGIDLGSVSTSMTINAPAAAIFAMFLAAAEKQGVPFQALRGTLQNDILKEYIAQKEWIFPPEPAMKLAVDVVEYCSKHVPQWNPISISGYHIREAGSTAAQELALTLADGIAYVEACRGRGMAVDGFAPRLSFFFNSYIDGASGFFEEVAKLRAARRMWAKIMRERFGAKDPKSWLLRIHVQTSGDSLKEEQPMNNIVRAALQALAAVLGGTQSLHVDAYDEQRSLPSEHAAILALRTQQIIAYETGIPEITDSLGGAWHLEALTASLEKEVLAIIKSIDDQRGMLRAIEKYIPQMWIEEESYQKQQRLDKNEITVVGVNGFLAAEGEEKSLRERYNNLCAAVMDEMNELRRQAFQIGMEWMESADGAAFKEVDTTELERLLRAREEAHMALRLEHPIPSRISPESQKRHLERLQRVRAERDPKRVKRTLAALKRAAQKEKNLMPYLLNAARSYVTLGEIRKTLIEVFGEYFGGM